jgi:hypothetical protein
MGFNPVLEKAELLSGEPGHRVGPQLRRLHFTSPRTLAPECFHDA